MKTLLIIIITVLLFVTSTLLSLYGYSRVVTKDLHMKDKTEADCTKNNAKGNSCGYWDSKNKLCVSGTMQNNTCKEVTMDTTTRVVFIFASLFLLSTLVFPIVMYFVNKNASSPVSNTPNYDSLKSPSKIASNNTYSYDAAAGKNNK